MVENEDLASPRRSRRRTIVASLVAGATAFAIAAGVALAGGSSENGGFSYITNTGPCTYHLAGIFTPPVSPGGQSGAQTFSQYYGSSKCNRYWGRPAGSIWVQAQLVKWTGSTWAYCTQTGVYYSQAYGDYTRGILVNWGATPRCGNGLYGTYAIGSVHDGNTWHGGSVFSGGVTIP